MPPKADGNLFEFIFGGAFFHVPGYSSIGNIESICFGRIYLTI